MSARRVNGSKVNGAAVPEVAYTEPIRRTAETPSVSPEFWFGNPLPEEALPPLPEEPPKPPKPQVPSVSTRVTEQISRRLDAPPDTTGHATERISRLPLDGPTELIPKVPPAVTPPVTPKAEPVKAEPAKVTPKPGAPKPVTPEADAEETDEERRRRQGKHRRPPRKQPLWRELLVLAGVALLLTFAIQHFIGRVYSIPSGSMEKTLHGCPECTGDRVFVDKIVYDFRDPSPGDVVVFQGPNTWTENDIRDKRSGNPLVRGLQYMGSLIGVAPPDERDFVKRVIAVGGQNVECCDEQNRVLVDGKPLDEPYVYWEHGGPDERQQFARVTVPEGTLWVMGDNRGNSSDSRFQGGGGIRGVVPLGKVIGKARYIVLPPSRWRGVGDHNPQGDADLAAAAWQQGIPAGLGLAAAWPVLWIGRRAKIALTSRKAD